MTAEDLAGISGDIIEFLEGRLEDDALAVARLLYVRLRQPHAYVTVAGETSTGKSSLVNALLERSRLPVSAAPTTATITHVVCRELPEDSAFAIYRDGTQAEIDAKRFAEMSRAPAPELLRLQLRAKPADARFLEFHVFDTPGYNAVVAEHEEILREFLPQSDVIVFVTGYRSGFGQVDQDLLETIRSSLAGREAVPVILAVNRVPAGTTVASSRIREIRANAADCLHYEPQLMLVESAPAPDTGSARGGAPDAMPVWDAVLGIVAAPEHRQMVLDRLWQLLIDLLDDLDGRFERREVELEADDVELAAIQEQIALLVEARKASLAAVDRLGVRLQLNLPKSIERSVPRLKEQMAAEINGSEKWLGEVDCVQWVAAHALPFAVRDAARTVEDQIAFELQELDRELEEIANTAVARISGTARVKSEAVRRFAENVTGTLLKRFLGQGVKSILRGFGGVGGMAAGTGNLVKMAVSRAGKLLGKTFNREIYNQIGKTFNKRALEKLQGPLQVLTEVATYVYQANTWQKGLTKRVDKGIEDWAAEVCKELIQSTIPRIVENNRKSIEECYEELIGENAGGGRAQDTAAAREDNRACRATIARLQQNLGCRR